jgi:transposase-like protein
VKLMRKLLKKRAVAPAVVVTDKRRSYGGGHSRSSASRPTRA